MVVAAGLVGRTADPAEGASLGDSAECMSELPYGRLLALRGCPPLSHQTWKVYLAEEIARADPDTAVLLSHLSMARLRRTRLEQTRKPVAHTRHTLETQPQWATGGRQCRGPGRQPGGGRRLRYSGTTSGSPSLRGNGLAARRPGLWSQRRGKDGISPDGEPAAGENPIMTQITIVLQNLQHGGTDRWPLLAERLGQAKPDIALLNEALGWTDNDECLLKQAEYDLGMTALRPLPPSRSGHHVVIMYRPETLGAPKDYNIDFSAQCEHGVAVAGWEVGLPRLLAVCTMHVSPFSPVEALIEAQKARWTALRYGDRKNDDHYYAVLGADFNGPPLAGPPADVSRMNVLDRAARFRDAACTIPNTDIAEAFAEVGFTDASEILDPQAQDERLFARTGRSDRIDRILVTHRLRSAVVGGELLDTPPDAADHRGVLTRIDTDLADRE